MKNSKDAVLPKFSFWGRFTKEGRIKNHWARALEESDPAKRRRRFGRVQQELASDPAAFSHLWLPFLDSLLEAPRVRDLSSSDLAKIEVMGEALSGLDLDLRPTDIWWRLVFAYDARRERQPAENLLTKICLSPTSSNEMKLRCARSLARRGATGKVHLDLYVACLRGITDPAAEKGIFALMARVCNVDFDTDKASLNQAADLARQLEKSRIQVHGGQRAIGLQSLLVKRNFPEAAVQLDKAWQEDRRDEVAQVGLLSALIQQADHDRVAKIKAEAGTLDDSMISGLFHLSASLNWLEDWNLAGPPPVAAGDLEGRNLAKFVGTLSLDMALGRLYLLEGNASRASQILTPLADRIPSQPRWHYYVTWAAALAGERNLTPHYSRLPQWPGRWSVTCLLWDLDPGLATETGFMTSLDEAPSPHLDLVKARLSLARGIVPPAGFGYESSAATLEEKLEGLRTVLGYEVFIGNHKGLAQHLASPLFARLPKADQVMWLGLDSLIQGNLSQGRTLLGEAANRLGHPRASLALAAHLLENHTNQLDEPNMLLDRLASRGQHPKIDLLRAYLYNRKGRSGKTQEILEGLAARKEPKAFFALGDFYLRLAEEARQNKDLEKLRLYRDQAAKAFRTAWQEGSEVLPNECEILAICAEFLAYPDRCAASLANLSQGLQNLKSDRLPPWAVWTALLSCFNQGGPAEAAAITPSVLKLLDLTENLDDRLAAWLAQEVARQCSAAKDPATANQLVKLLDCLTGTGTSDEMKRYGRLGITAAWRSGYFNSPEKERRQVLEQVVQLAKLDPGNGPLALLLAAGYLEADRLTEAVAALRAVSREDALAANLCTVIADLLEGSTPSVDDLPWTEASDAGEWQAACHLLKAAAAFLGTALETGYEEILKGLQVKNVDVNAIFHLGKFIPQLCALATKSSAPIAALKEALLQTCLKAEGPSAIMAGRCVAVLGDADLACSLWERGLTGQRGQDGAEIKEFINYICHLGVKAHKEGNSLQAAERFRQAANFKKSG